MQRVKNFDATGIALTGRLYAGDLNLIQDAAAALTDFTQTISLAELRIGESGLTLSRFGVGIARLQGRLNVAGHIRAENGIYVGEFSNSQRNAMPYAPKGTIIFNVEEDYHEWNQGTDEIRNWQAFNPATDTSGALSSRPSAGSVFEASTYYATDQVALYQVVAGAWVRMGPGQAGDIVWTAEASARPGFVLPQGQIVSRSGIYADLFAKWGTMFNTGGETGAEFRLFDHRGRLPVGVGTHFEVDGVGDHDNSDVAIRRTKHGHPHTHTANHDHDVSYSSSVSSGAQGRLSGKVLQDYASPGQVDPGPGTVAGGGQGQWVGGMPYVDMPAMSLSLSIDVQPATVQTSEALADALVGGPAWITLQPQVKL